TYTGDQRSHAAYLQFFAEFSEKWHLLVGLRAEQIHQAVSWQTQLSAQPGGQTLEKSAFLPHIQFKYRWTEQQQFRFSASKTYTLPQFKERAVFVYEDV